MINYFKTIFETRVQDELRSILLRSQGNKLLNFVEIPGEQTCNYYNLLNFFKITVVISMFIMILDVFTYPILNQKLGSIYFLPIVIINLTIVILFCKNLPETKGLTVKYMNLFLY